MPADTCSFSCENSKSLRISECSLMPVNCPFLHWAHPYEEEPMPKAKQRKCCFQKGDASVVMVLLAITAFCLGYYFTRDKKHEIFASNRYVTVRLTKFQTMCFAQLQYTCEFKSAFSKISKFWHFFWKNYLVLAFLPKAILMVKQHLIQIVVVIRIPSDAL